MEQPLLVGAGHAMIDITAQLDEKSWESFLDRSGLSPDEHPIHVDAEKAAGLALLLKESVRNGGGTWTVSSGGSAFNTLAIAAMLGIPGEFIGSIGKDDNGDFFGSELSRIQVPMHLRLARHDIPTGVFCHIGNAQGQSIAWACPAAARKVREMLSNGQILPAMTAAASPGILHLEGLLFDEPDSLDKLCRKARAEGWKLSFDLVSAGFIARHSGAARALISEHADFIFCTRKEQDALRMSAGDQNPSQCWIVKEDVKGVMCHYQGRQCYHEAPHVPVVHTTGAGDAFAGAFLAGMFRHQPVETCMEMGSAAAGCVLRSEEGIFNRTCLLQSIKSILAAPPGFSLH